jgi:hypothetical protein
MAVVNLALEKALTGKEARTFKMVARLLVVLLLYCSLVSLPVSGAQERKNPLSIEDIEFLLHPEVSPLQ